MAKQDNIKAWSVEYYVDNRGDSPVIEFIDGLSLKDQAKIRNYIRYLQEFGTKLSQPYAKDLAGQKPLWELLPDPYRLIYFLHKGHTFVLLHAFRKRSNETKKKDIDTAKRRMEISLERDDE